MMLFHDIFLISFSVEMLGINEIAAERQRDHLTIATSGPIFNRVIRNSPFLPRKTLPYNTPFFQDYFSSRGKGTPPAILIAV